MLVKVSNYRIRTSKTHDFSGLQCTESFYGPQGT